MKTYGIWYTNGAFNMWIKLIKLYEMGIYLVAKIPDIIDERLQINCKLLQDSIP